MRTQTNASTKTKGKQKEGHPQTQQPSSSLGRKFGGHSHTNDVIEAVEEICQEGTQA